MKHWAIGLIGLVLSLSLTVDANARAKTGHTVAGRPQLNTAINGAISSIRPSANVGIIIKSMKYGDTLYSRNERNFFIPASILKVMTAEAALLYLGPQFHFTTRFVSNNPRIKNGQLIGDVYLVHSGDPTLTYVDLYGMVAALKTLQINEIIGNVYIDNTAYDQVLTGPGWLWNDKHYCYAAPISASIINHNCLSFQVGPGKTNGARAEIKMNPHYYYAGIRNAVTTRNYPSRTCYVKLDGTDAGIISISGCMSKGHYAAGITTVINDIADYNKSLLTSLFHQFNIRVQGQITLGKASPNARVLSSHDSKPLQDLVNDMLKMSDNVIAGSLFKKIGQIYTHRSGTWESGSTAVNAILSKQAGVDIWRLNVMDGSGLSRYNQVTPKQILQLLDFAFHNRATNLPFVTALPIAGVDGTLKKRMHNIPWRVRAKTGTMAGVVSLAGYAMSADKEPFAFVIMINGNHGSVWQYREMEDKVLTYLTHYSRS